jgi:hypothetical protein
VFTLGGRSKRSRDCSGTLGIGSGDDAGRHADVVEDLEVVIVGLSLEVVSSWIRSCTEPKQLDKLVTLVERQRVVIADKVKAKQAKRKPDAMGHDGA